MFQQAALSTKQIAPATIQLDTKTGLLRCEGDWTAARLDAVGGSFRALGKSIATIKVINICAIKRLDSAGALLLVEMVQQCKKHGTACRFTGIPPQFASIIELVTKAASGIQVPPAPQKKSNYFYRVGEWTVDKYRQVTDFLAFIGEVIEDFARLIVNPSRLRWGEIGCAIEDVGYDGLPILALLSFLIGVVLAYQLGIQLQAYGANVFIVDVTGTATLREFGPLITAIVLAARTSTAFTSLIGTMKVNEELDALATMGITPVERLVIPRVLGLLIAFPLLTVWANIFTIAGAMLMAKAMLGISYHGFLARFQIDVALRDYLLGLYKTPIFGLIIVGVGCFQGFQVQSTADSVGKQTTKAAVQAIFLIIVADAIYSVAYNWLGV